MASGVSEVKDSLRRVFGNANLRRVQLAFFGSLMGDVAYATAITVWAFDQGGATAVGVFAGARFIASAVAGPLGSLVADKVPRKSFMVSTDLVRAVLVAIAALSISTDLPALVVYALAMATSIVGAPFRSAQAGLIPKLVDTPDELTASNAVAANFENVVVFVGPALGALLVGFFDVEVVFWFNVATYLWSFAMVVAIRVPDAAPSDEPGGDGEEEAGFLAEASAGFRMLGQDADLRAIALLAGSQGFLWGALQVGLVVIAVDVLDSGAHGVGYLMAVMGVGTVLGGLVTLARASKGKLAQDMVVGVLGWALPLVVLAVVPNPVVAIVCLAVVGLLDPWVNLGFETIPQRITPDKVLSRVYAAVESALIGAMALGAFLAPVALDLVGLRWTLAVMGVLVALYAVSSAARMRSLDGRLSAPEHLPLLSSISLFSPLSPPVREALARRLVAVSVPAGQPVVSEGEASDRFYVIRSGQVEVTQGAEVLRTEGPGEFFGEIGLLRDVARTATVTARSDTELLALERGDFIDAVTGQNESRIAAEEVVTRRLGV